MPQINEYLLNRVLTIVDYSDADVNKAVFLELQALLDQPEGEPVATVLNRGEKMLRVGVLNAEGMRLTDGTKLYTHPPAPRKITTADVTDEMVLTCFRHFPEIICNRGAIDTAKPHIAAAVNAYLPNLEKL